MPGSHRRDGIHVMLSPGLPAGERRREIADVLPLWLAASGWAQVLDDAPAAPPDSVPSPASPAALERRLRGLGYLP